MSDTQEILNMSRRREVRNSGKEEMITEEYYKTTTPTTITTTTNPIEKESTINTISNNNANLQETVHDFDSQGLNLNRRSVSILQRISHEILPNNNHNNNNEFFFFSLQEPDGTYIDIIETFAPKPHRNTIVLRCLCLGITLDVFFRPFIFSDKSHQQFYMAYLTHWGLFVSIIYQLCALSCSILFLEHFSSSSSLGLQPNNNISSLNDDDGRRRRRRQPIVLLVRIMWAAYDLATPAEVIIVLLYWLVVYDGGPLHYLQVMKHGGVLICLFIDGLFWTVIPTRIPHCIMVQSFAIVYLLWTILFALSDISNPDEDDTDDYIYGALRWKRNFYGAMKLSILAGCFLPSIVFAMVWFLSLWSFPCYFYGQRRKIYGQPSYYYSKQQQQQQQQAAEYLDHNNNDDDERGVEIV